jgi:hypothetical protein
VKEQQDLKGNRQRHHGRCSPAAAVLFDSPADDPPDQDTQEQDQDPQRLAPRIKQYRKDQQHGISSAPDRQIDQQKQRKESEKKHKARKNHSRPPHIHPLYAIHRIYRQAGSYLQKYPAASVSKNGTFCGKNSLFFFQSDDITGSKVLLHYF